MPRPKPKLPLKNRYLRMSDVEWLMFKDLGGAEWLRTMVKKKAKFSTPYYMLKLKEQNDSKSR
jgi:hypothetical protein